MSKLIKFQVESYDVESDDYEEMGVVLLPDHAQHSHVEHALAAVGVYAPRGADELHWDCGTSYPYAQILDASGACIVRLREAET